MAFVFKIDGESAPLAEIKINYVVTNINCSLTDDNLFATCGEKHMILCTFDGKDNIKKN